MKKTTLLLLSALFFLFLSCQKEEPEVALYNGRTFPEADQRLWSFFERFEAEAALRGIDIDLVAEGITADIKEIEQEYVAGQCTYGARIDNHIIIDRTFWQSSVSDYIREMVVFHELGHCHLLRGHREDVHPDGSCVSIMRSGAGDCFDNYYAATRHAYLDELFDENNP